MKPKGTRRPDRTPIRQRLELGLAVSALSLQPGQTRTITELAAYCGCSKQNISAIEHRALIKVRRHLLAKGIKFSHLQP